MGERREFPTQEGKHDKLVNKQLDGLKRDISAAKVIGEKMSQSEYRICQV